MSATTIAPVAERFPVGSIVSADLGVKSDVIGTDGKALRNVNGYVRYTTRINGAGDAVSVRTILDDGSRGPARMVLAKYVTPVDADTAGDAVSAPDDEPMTLSGDWADEPSDSILLND